MLLDDQRPSLDLARYEDNGYWNACFGTKGSWDAMRVNNQEMLRVLTEYAEAHHTTTS